MQDEDSRHEVPKGQLSLTGPGAQASSGHLPVRGDLAHIKLAGRYFVPHYAVPMLHRVTGADVILRASASPHAEAVAPLAQATRFEVLDIVGDWSWGQAVGEAFGEEGPVGYIPLSDLEVDGQ